MWLAASIGSALFAGLTAILAKCGIRKTDSDIATAIRTIVVLIFSWVMVFIVGSADQITEITPRSLLFLILSGAATGASWICYFKALSIGDVNKVVPIDKSSTVLSVLLAILLFHETEHLAVKLISTVLLGIGIILMVEKKQSEQKVSGNTYILYAIGSAVFAALTSILAKVGITGGGVQLGHGHTDDCSSRHGMVACTDQEENTSAKAARQKGAWLYRIIRDCHRCILAVLLLRYSEWHSQRSCAD